MSETGKVFRLELTLDEAELLQATVLYAHARLIPPPMPENLRNVYIVSRQQFILSRSDELRKRFTSKMERLAEEMGQ